MKCPKCDSELYVIYQNTTVDFSISEIGEEGSVYTDEIVDIDFAHADGPFFSCDNDHSPTTEEIVDAMIKDAKNG